MIGTAGSQPRDPFRVRPHRQSVWYDTRPPGQNIMWDGPGWYTITKAMRDREGKPRATIIRIG